MRALVWTQTMRIGVVPVFTNRWAIPAGTTTTEPGPAARVRSPAVNMAWPSSTIHSSG